AVLDGAASAARGDPLLEGRLGVDRVSPAGRLRPVRGHAREAGDAGGGASSPAEGAGRQDGRVDAEDPVRGGQLEWLTRASRGLWRRRGSAPRGSRSWR